MSHTVHMPWYYHTPTLSGQAMRVAGYVGMQCCRGRQPREGRHQVLEDGCSILRANGFYYYSFYLMLCATLSYSHFSRPILHTNK